MLGPALIDVAQVAVVLAPESSLTVISEPLVKLGSSFTAVTVIVKVVSGEMLSPPFDVPPLSETLTVTVAEPLASVADVNVKVPDEFTEGALLNSEALSLDTLKVRL